MTFNSLEFFLFMPVVYLAYYFSPDRFRWMLLLAASFIFYAALKVPYLLGVLLLVATATYAFGLWLDRAPTPQAKYRLLWAGVVTNILILGVLKYIPFHAFVAIGVSFYVFQAISYLIDVHDEIEKPEPHFGYFLLYLAFFPKLLQGPIERAGHLIPQLKVLRPGDLQAFRSGMWMIVGGLFKKVVIAERLALLVDPVYSNVQDYAGISLLLATYVYAFQIYYDFSGYTDIALGTARLFGVDLTENFHSPYSATSVADFWRRWHISFSRWILDYIFKPLQMRWRDWQSWGTASALVVTFLACGLWHGSSWGFLIWGGLHGIYMASSVFYNPYQKRLDGVLGLKGSPYLRLWRILVTFNLVCLAWIFFRASNLKDAVFVATHLFGGIGDMSRLIDLWGFREPFVALISMGLLALLSFLSKRQHLAEAFFDRPFWARCLVYYGVIMYLLVLGSFSSRAFVYVRF